MSRVALCLSGTALHEAHHVGVDLAESSQRIVGRRYERFVRLPSVLLGVVVELTEVSERR